MKKIIVLILLFIILNIQGCNNIKPQYPHLESKPNVSYYSEILYSQIEVNDNYTMEILNTNLYKTYTIKDKDKNIIKNLFKSIPNQNYTNKKKLPENEAYRIKIYVNNEIYLIKVFSNELISISPWDGNYKEDIITMDNVPKRYNLYDYCIYIEDKHNYDQ